MKSGNNQESWMNEAASSNMMVATNALVGDVPTNVLNGTTTSWIPGGIVGATTKSVAFLYHPPFSGVQYMASVKDNFLGKPAYAVTGFVGLNPLLPLWRGFRNATYIIFSLVFVLMGIGIMLRIKISPQSVITLQSAIPKIITALILVTFSYAIVGLLLDLTSVVEGLGLSIISSAGSNIVTNISDMIQHPEITGRVFGLAPLGAITIFAGIIGGILALIPAVGWVIGLIAFGIIFLGTIIFILVQALKFFFGLLKCYISILLKTIIGPLEIALGAIPNMKMGFGSWFTDIIANVLVFPISFIFLVMIKTLMDTIYHSNNLWSPPGLDFLASGPLLSVFVGLGGLMIVAKLPKMIPEFIFQIKPSPWGNAIGEGFKPFGSPVKGGARYGISSAGERIGTRYGGEGVTPSEKAATAFGKITEYFNKN